MADNVTAIDIKKAAAPAAAEDRSTIAWAYAAFAGSLRYEAVPESARERAKRLILDAVGIAFASTQYDFAHRTLAGLRALADPHEGEAGPVIGTTPGLPWRDAIVANGVLVHGLDFDDTHVEGVIHATASAFPAAFGLAARLDLDGKDLLLGYLVAVETACRLGMAAKGGFHKAGYHPTALLGTFASAVGAGKLLGLTDAQLVDAQGIALSMAGGTLEFLKDGAWTKRLHPGWAALSGVSAATLAKSGFQGTTETYEGRYGLYRTHLGALLDDGDLALATAGLGESWQTEAIAVKPLPACHLTHASADAAMILAKQHDLSAERIAEVEVIVPREVVAVVCEPAAQKKRPANPYEAQFSIPYIVAAALSRRRFTLADIEPEAIADPAVLALAQRVRYSVDPDSPYPKYFSGEVVVTTKDGLTVRHRERMNRGCADRPLSAADIDEKFRANAGSAIAAARVERVRDAILGLDHGITARDLARVLAG